MILQTGTQTRVTAFKGMVPARSKMAIIRKRSANVLHYTCRHTKHPFDMFDYSFLLTIGIISLGTMIGAWLRSRRKDPCLKDFDGYHITLEQLDNKIAWGTLWLASNALELRYREAIQDDQHIESSYVLYSEEFAKLHALYRYADRLTEENREKRRKDIDRSFDPPVWRRWGRKTRNFLHTATESLNDVVGVVIGRARKPAGHYITDTSAGYLKTLGSEVVGHMGSAYDPMMETFIGQKVVVEVVEDGNVHEHVGILKNYSADFIQLLDVQFPYRQDLTLTLDGKVGAHQMHAETDGDAINVSNDGNHPMLVQSLIHDGEEQLLNVVVDSGESITIHPEAKFERARLSVRVVRSLDMIVPRNHCVIRHRAGLIEEERLTDIVFDLGVALTGSDKRMRRREERLRANLKRSPSNALAAANLGGLLIQQHQYDEAERWLLHALKMQNSLPDNGRRARMQLNELRLREQRRTGTLADRFLTV